MLSITVITMIPKLQSMVCFIHWLVCHAQNMGSFPYWGTVINRFIGSWIPIMFGFPKHGMIKNYMSCFDPGTRALLKTVTLDFVVILVFSHWFKVWKPVKTSENQYPIDPIDGCVFHKPSPSTVAYHWCDPGNRPARHWMAFWSRPRAWQTRDPCARPLTWTLSSTSAQGWLG